MIFLVSYEHENTNGFRCASTTTVARTHARTHTCLLDYLGWLLYACVLLKQIVIEGTELIFLFGE